MQTIDAVASGKLPPDSLELLPKTWLLAGGGWKNPVILKYLQQYLGEKIKDPVIKLASEIGFDSTYMEAELFAYLAVRSYKGLPISIPSVTGASKPSLAIFNRLCACLHV